MNDLNALLFRGPRPNIRADIQAMRAVAVLAVVLYHLWPYRFNGGFVGVDIFFVISGFLMTSHLVKSLENGGTEKSNRRKFFTDFYLKRIRRLAPASLVLLASVLAIVWVLFRQYSSLLSSTALQVISSALFVQNWTLVQKAVDYLAQNNGVTMVEHFWSLSIEEQFYLIWPMLLMLFMLVGVYLERPRLTLLVLVCLFTLFSFVYGIYLTNTYPALAYFATPARLWELSMGGIIALLPPSLTLASNKNSLWSNANIFRQSLPFLGLLSCLAAIVFFDHENISFPGFMALVPTTGIAITIWSGIDNNGQSHLLFDRLAAFTPAQFIGDISYSLYLWHYVCINAYYYFDLYFGDATVTSVEKIVLVLPLSFVLASVSFYFIEQPCLKVSKRSFILVPLAVSFVLVVGTAFAVYQYGLAHGATQRARSNLKINDAIDAEMNQRSTPLLCVGAIAIDHPDVCGDAYGVLEEGLVDDVDQDVDITSLAKCDGTDDKKIDNLCYLGDTKSDKTILLWGDSHAMHFSDALDIAAKQLGYKLVVAVRFACPPLEFSEGDTRVVHLGDGEFALEHSSGCVKRNNFVLNSDVFKNADLVLLSSLYFSPSLPAPFEGPLKVFADNFQRLGDKKIAVVSDVPLIQTFPDAVPAITLNKQAYMLRREILSIEKRSVATNDRFFESLDKAGVNYIKMDTTDRFCKDDKCYLAVGSLPVYRDGHITGSYSKTLGPWFARELKKALNHEH